VLRRRLLRRRGLLRVLRLGPHLSRGGLERAALTFLQLDRVEDGRVVTEPPALDGYKGWGSRIGESTAKLKSPRRGAWIVDRTNEDRIRCYFDGACPRNQFRSKGRMQAAFVVGDTKAIREVLDLLAPSGPLRSNNIAEYMALILLLEHIHQIARRTLPEGYMICGDSQLVIRQMRGEYRVKTPHLVPLHAKAKQLSSNLDVQFRWVPRDQNLAGVLLETSGMKDPKGSSRGI